VDIGKRYKREELIESIINPSAKIAQGFDTYVFATEDGKIYTGFVTGEGAEAVRIRQSNGVEVVIPQSQIEERAKQSQSMMPQQVAGNLTPEELADLLAWLESLKSES
jgi:putative heme-binding domain-containing protein